MLMSNQSSVAPARLGTNDAIGLAMGLFDRRGRRHPVWSLTKASRRPHHESAIGLEHQQSDGSAAWQAWRCSWATIHRMRKRYVALQTARQALTANAIGWSAAMTGRRDDWAIDLAVDDAVRVPGPSAQAWVRCAQ
jgi:hypothetical protein